MPPMPQLGNSEHLDLVIGHDGRRRRQCMIDNPDFGLHRISALRTPEKVLYTLFLNHGRQEWGKVNRP